MKYSTNFASAEAPISESGAWAVGSSALDWHGVDTTGGYAYGTQLGNTNYDDSIAILSGLGAWGWHQRARATYLQNATPLNSTTAFIEVELLLHMTFGSHSVTGYEMTVATSPDQTYLQINRWNGALGDFTTVATATITTKGTTPATADVFEFREEGTASVPLLRVYQNGVFLLEYDTTPDTTKYTAGSPGLGFYDGNGVTNAGQQASTWSKFDASDDYFDGETIQTTGNAPSSSATSTTQAFGSNVRQGDLLVAVGWHGGTVAGSFGDSRGNTWAVIGGVTNVTDGHRLDIGIAVSKDAGASTVTYTHSGDAATTFRAVAVAEFKSAFGTDQSNNGTSNSGTASSGASPTTTAAFELLLGTFGGSNAGGIPVPTTNFRTLTDVIGGPSTKWLLSLLSRLTYVTGSFTSTATLGTSQQWSALVNTLSLIATQSLVNYRFRNDDGSETTATWKSPELTNISVLQNQLFRLRFQIDTTGDEPSQPLTLQFRKVGDPTWTTLTKLSKIQLANSPNIAPSAATATTTQLTAPAGKTGSSFTAGVISDDTNPISSVNIDLNFYSEFEFALVAASAPTPGEQYEFQLSGTAMTNTVVPRITIQPLIAAPQIPLQMRMG